jgi:hypothetical protein
MMVTMMTSTTMRKMVTRTMMMMMVTRTYDDDDDDTDDDDDYGDNDNDDDGDDDNDDDNDHPFDCKDTDFDYDHIHSDVDNESYKTISGNPINHCILTKQNKSCKDSFQVFLNFHYQQLFLLVQYTTMYATFLFIC